MGLFYAHDLLQLLFPLLSDILKSMKTVYVDDMFLLNLVINFFLLMATARLCALPIKRLRFALAAALGALYAVALLLPSLGFLASPLTKLCLGAAMTLIAFGGAKRLLRPYLAFLLVSAAFGGAVMAVGLLSGGSVSDAYFIGTTFKTLILTFGGAYFVLTLLFSRIAKHREREILPAALCLCGKYTSFSALSDTGNELFDPISNLPVMVAGADVAAALLPEDCLAALSSGAAEFIASLLPYDELAPRFRLVPYSAIGTDYGLIPVFRPDSLAVGGKEQKNLLVGLSPSKLSATDEYSAIV